ncbi:UDP-glucose 4-epimerase GalE [Deinococcus metallilatus]|uniref:UDP-glucose 4-epimerase n=1 Tax=Deinococcus metallilatus TaxID=1211322 RepID=A0AAJ5JXM5_9DEIO|nr:UDP-glucose 4-epimerase GalE [Deinococcus metallilatus]MBB5297033.1 UDP-glucose 4-epimerase [Deinococcus metallilatus]QBY07838.1 UDP-glucose 4-epimerase GalE [Deinococcus metallilatus]RXJ13187.1 UDP-glucose 4-epimerase GalE [Deinococcus metallilatus]TLK23040.1 UDP-glucose 4-epimerase GalE [Deinococcus metallilatus]
MKVLVTGGAGYIGSTVCSALKDAGHVPVILDSLITGQRAFVKDRIFYHGDIADEVLLRRIFAEHPDIGAVIHFAALIVVPESVAVPLRYYQENVSKSIILFQTLLDHDVERVIFSSSASIYDTTSATCVSEESSLLPASPYARTKLMMEMILEDVCRASNLRGIALRYFNPIGADPQFRSGPYRHDPSHVLGRMLETARGRSGPFQVTGVDYPTRDGTGLRDYIHVWDLALAHVQAVEQFDRVFERAQARGMKGHYLALNVGSGNGVTVRELIGAFEHASGLKLPHQDAARRPGDSPGAYAVIERARELLGWEPRSSTETAIRSALEWDERYHQAVKS